MVLSRTEAEEIIKEINKLNKSPKYKIIIAGSYRREAQIIRDIDILMVSKKDKWDVDIPIDLLKLPGTIVEANKGIVHRLVTIVYKTKKIKCDIYAVNKTDLPFGLLHSTGGRESNLRLRRIAISKGWLLNQYGLWYRDRPTVKVAGTENIKTEKEIYEKLGKPYKSPPERS